MNTTQDTGTPAGAQTTTETVSATKAAADAGNVSDFLAASRDARMGKPREAVTREVKAPADAKPEPKPSKWDTKEATPGADTKPAAKAAEKPAPKGPSDADRQADERIRRIVGDATAELRRQNDELRKQLQGLNGGGSKGEEKKAEPRQRPADAPLTKAEIKRYQDMPGAPKLDDRDPDTGEFLYDSANEHSIALANFISRKQGEERAAEETRSRNQVLRSEREQKRVESFAGRVDAWKGEHADQLVDRVVRDADGTERTIKAVPLSEDVQRLHGWAMLAHINQQRRERGLDPLPPSVDHAIAECLYDSEAPVDVAVYLSKHPNELAYLRGAGSEADLAQRFGRVEERASRGANPTKQPADPATGGDGTTTKPKTVAEAKREAEAAVDRSVSSAKPPETTLGKGHPSADGEESAMKSGNVGAFLEIQRQRRIEARLGRRG